jgi:hypothetical protein
MSILKRYYKKAKYQAMRPINAIKREIRYRKRLKELKKRDPFIYK